jgi:filamentous hemagglutinin family protein
MQKIMLHTLKGAPMKVIIQRFLAIGLPLASLLVATPPVLAQVIPNNTLGTQVTQTGNVFEINNGTRSGNNLFHSFSQFSVPTEGSAIFNNATDVQNIFSRVTGSQLSNIDGLLKTQGTANLFLMNPNGIIFGPNAKLELGGSFLGTSASSIKFSDAIEFNTLNTTPALLSVKVPLGLQFGNNPGRIVIQDSNLKVASEKSILLAGNAMDIVGNLTAKGGRIDLVSISGEGLVSIEPDLFQQLSLRITDSTPRGYLRVGAPLDTGKSAELRVDNPRGGSIGITAKNFDFLGDTAIYAGVLGIGSISQKSGNIDINVSERFYVDFAIAASRINRNSIGNAGDINIVAGDMIAVNGVQFSASNRGRGTGGNINITAKNTIDFSGQDQDGFQTSLFSSVRTGAVGNGGTVTLNARSVSFRDGASLELITEGNGNAGNVKINATDSIIFRGVAKIPDSDGSQNFSGILSNVRSTGRGNGGSIELNAPIILVEAEAKLSTSNQGIGNAGNINIAANLFKLDRGASLTAESASGNQGNIVIQTTDLTLLRNNSLITTNASGSASGGNIFINSPIIVGLENSDISANAVRGRGGNVEILTQSLLGLTYRPISTPESDITASSEFGINGSVEVNTIGINPANALTTLPVDVVDASTQIADRCGTAKTSSFIATGRGGVPKDPIKNNHTNRTWHDVRTNSLQTSSIVIPIATQPIEPLVEASGIEVDTTGAIALVSAKSIASQLGATCGLWAGE